MSEKKMSPQAKKEGGENEKGTKNGEKAHKKLNSKKAN